MANEEPGPDNCQCTSAKIGRKLVLAVRDTIKVFKELVASFEEVDIPSVSSPVQVVMPTTGNEQLEHNGMIIQNSSDSSIEIIGTETTVFPKKISLKRNDALDKEWTDASSLECQGHVISDKITVLNSSRKRHIIVKPTFKNRSFQSGKIDVASTSSREIGSTPTTQERRAVKKPMDAQGHSVPKKIRTSGAKKTPVNASRFEKFKDTRFFNQCTAVSSKSSPVRKLVPKTRKQRTVKKPIAAENHSGSNAFTDMASTSSSVPRSEPKTREKTTVMERTDAEAHSDSNEITANIKGAPEIGDIATDSKSMTAVSEKEGATYEEISHIA